MPAKYKAILFDLDGTLRLNLPLAGEVFIEYVKSIGISVTEKNRTHAERWEHEYFASSPQVKADGQKFKDDPKGFWRNFTKLRLTALLLNEEMATELAPQVSDHMNAFYKPQAYVPDEAFPLLQFLKDKEYILGVVSNRESKFDDELETLNLKSYFRFTLSGGEVDSYKPEMFIFKRALELAGTTAAETMYVGDNYYADIVGALRSGLTPVLYDPSNIFPEAGEGCAVIKNYSEFYDLLNG